MDTPWVYYAISFIVAYLLGSCNASIIVSKLMGGDVRDHGSGNAGLTNMYRTFGAPTALLVLILDVLKGIVSLAFAWMICQNVPQFKFASYCFAAAGAILGHCYPVYFGFKGGKGVLTACAILMLLNPYVGLCSLLLFAVLVAITRYVSLGSCVAALFIVPFTIFLPNFRSQNAAIFPLGAFMTVFIIFQHRSNIKRLLNGTENKLSFHKQK